MRVLTVGNMYPPHHLGGYELMWRSAVGFLREAGHEVRVLTTDYRATVPDSATPDDADVHRELRWYWREHEFPRLPMRERLRLERHNAEVLEAHLEAHRPQVVSWWAMGGMSLSLIEHARRAGLPASAVVVDDWLLYGPRVDAWQRPFGARLPRLGRVAERVAGVPSKLDLDSAAVWLFASETLRRRARDAGLRLERTEVAHPGIDLDLFRAQPRPPWRGRLLYCGRIDERKGIDTGVRSLRHLPDETTLSIIGGGDDEHLRSLKALAHKEGVARRVEFERRPRDLLPAAYADADVVLFPVRWVEPFGLVPLEAMAVGAPVVASGLGGSAEYLRDGENCVLFDVEHGAEALAEAVRGLAHSPSLRDRLNEGGRATAARFDKASFNTAVEEALIRAVEGRP